MADETTDPWPPLGPPAAGDEVATLLGSLERQRATFAWKCGGLDATGMQARVGASTMTLGGLVKHVTLVEADYFAHRLWGRDPGAPWNAVDWDADPDWEWRTAARARPHQPPPQWRGCGAPPPTTLPTSSCAYGARRWIGRGLPSTRRWRTAGWTGRPSSRGRT